MKKTLILIFLFVFFITGCSDTSNVHKLDEQEKDPTSDILLKREEERNMKVISKLQTLLNKTYNTNYAFEYNISYPNETYNIMAKNIIMLYREYTMILMAIK